MKFLRFQKMKFVIDSQTSSHVITSLVIHITIKDLCSFADDFNRVVLKTLLGEEHSDYINASYVDVIN